MGKLGWLKPAIAATCLVTSSAVYAAIWGSSAQWGQYSNGPYTWYNNIWGSGAGAQSIWVNSQSSWGVWTQQPNTGGIKSYPHQAFNMNRNIWSINTLTASFNQTTPGFGSWNTAFDIWDTGHQNEIMVWTNWAGTMKPISYNWDASGNPIPTHRNVCVGGGCWNVYRGHNGANNVYSFLRTTKTNNASVNLRDILRWGASNGLFGNLYITSVEYGTEVTSTNNSGATFNFNNWFTWN